MELYIEPDPILLKTLITENTCNTSSENSEKDSETWVVVVVVGTSITFSGNQVTIKKGPTWDRA